MIETENIDEVIKIPSRSLGLKPPKLVKKKCLLKSFLLIFKKITFQDEMIKSWHQNKTFNFSMPIQKGILGKTYAKLKSK